MVESCALSNSTFVIDGTKAEFVGHGDQHNSAYDYIALVEFLYGEEVHIEHEERPHYEEDHELCQHKLFIFPSDTLKSSYETSKPLNYTIVVVTIFIFTAIVFILYDFYVTHRQLATQQTANKSNAIIKELFPGAVAEQLYEGASSKKTRDGINDYGESYGKAIAEFYPEATVLFADIAGFTAWSSIREPQSVFTLLESVFQCFDTLAKRHGVFKVETVGGNYSLRTIGIVYRDGLLICLFCHRLLRGCHRCSKTEKRPCCGDE